jgi:Lipocalin-like domain
VVRLFALALAACCSLQPEITLAQDAAKQLVGTWKLTSEFMKLEGGDTFQAFGPNPKGRLVLTSDGHMIIIITRSGRGPAKNLDEKAALLDSMLAYSGKYTIEGDRITNRIDMSWNEIFTGALQTQTRFFSVEGDTLVLRTGLIASAVRPGQRGGKHSHLGTRALRARIQPTYLFWHAQSTQCRPAPGPCGRPRVSWPVLAT